MESFSERRGLKLKSTLQTDSMTFALRTALWSVIHDVYLARLERDPLYRTPSRFRSMPENQRFALIRDLWNRHLCNLPETLGETYAEGVDKIRNYFFSCMWNEVYDLLEFIANSPAVYYESPDFELFDRSCNVVLAREHSAYLLINKRTVQVADIGDK